MIEKEISKKSIYLERFPLENSFVDIEKIKFNALKNYWGNFRLTDNINDYRNNYYQITDDKNVQWIADYILDKWKIFTNTQVTNLKKYFLIQEQNQLINSHHHILSNDLLNSPIISGIYTIDCGEIPTDLVIEDTFKRFETQKIRIPMKKNNFIFFNSDLNHYFEANQNKEPLINLSFSFVPK